MKVILLCSNLHYLLVLCQNCWIYSCQNCWSVRKESNCRPVTKCCHFRTENICYIVSTIQIFTAVLSELQYLIFRDSKVTVIEVWYCFLKLTYEKCKTAYVLTCQTLFALHVSFSVLCNKTSQRYYSLRLGRSQSFLSRRARGKPWRQ